MAIRFQCAACAEPIEVDDHWAQMVVRCPYCQRTITAPSESTLPQAEAIPTAARLQPVAESPVRFAGTPNEAVLLAAPPFPSPATNRAAVAALILACIMLGLMFAVVLILSRHSLELMDMQDEMKKAQAAGVSGFTAMNRYFEKQGGALPSWLVALVVIEMSIAAVWLATVILGVIGLFRPYRRAVAVISLTIAGLVCMLFCVGIIGSLGLAG